MTDELADRRSRRESAAGGTPGRSPVPVFPGHALWIRVLLATCASLQLLVGIPLALGIVLPGTSSAQSTHLVRDGTLACLLGVVLVAVAARPRWSRPLTVVAVAIFVVQLLGSTGDLAAGNVRPTFELVHVVGAVGVIGCVIATLRAKPRFEMRPHEDSFEGDGTEP